jgi:hypothetical protein
MKYSELKTLIKETVQKKLLKEENSINREIENAAYQIYGFVLEHHLDESEKVEENNDFALYKFDKIFKFFNTKIFVFFEFRKYKDGNKIVDCDSTSATSSGKGATMTIRYNTTKGTFSCGELYDSIQHELTHIFKETKPFQKNPSYWAPKALRVSSISGSYYRSKNKYQKIIGTVFYMLLKDEQDAYINGLYASIKNNYMNGIMPYKTIGQSPLIAKIKELLDIKEMLNELFADQKFINELNYFEKNIHYYKHLNKTEFEKKIDIIIERLCIKFANMIKAFQKFLLNSGMRVNGKLNNLTLSMFF